MVFTDNKDKKLGILSLIMFLAEGIINNFIEAMEESDLAHIDDLDDSKAFEYLAKLYKVNYGALPSGTGIYFLRTKFQLGKEEDNMRFIPSSFF